MTIKLLAIDLDGTLLDNDSRISPENIAALERAVEAGLHVVISTGRSFQGAHAILAPLPEEVQKEYIIVTNGATLLHIGQEKIEAQHHLTPSMIQEVLAFSAPYQNAATQLLGISLNKVYLVDALTPGPAAIREADFLQTGITYVTGEELLQCSDINALLLTGPVDEITQAYEHSLTLSEKGVAYTHSLPWMLEFLKPGVHKASALRELCEILDLRMDQVMAFGDQANDLEMLQEAGIGVAMQNAPLFMQEIADYVTKTNEENGVAYAIHQLLDNKLKLKAQS